MKCPIQEIARRAGEAGIPFLVIGGYAVIAHGYVRTTDDLDLITERGRRAHFGELLRKLGMSIANDAANFIQFDATTADSMDVDLMFVTEDVYGQLERAAIASTVDGVVTRVVSLPHLIALKCHAICHSESRLRRLKDVDDLIHLVLLNRLDLNEPELRDTILRHGDQELYDKLRRACTE